MAVQRGEIYFVNLNPVEGREQAGQRPVLVLSVDSINRLPLVVTVVVGTKGENVRGIIRRTCASPLPKAACRWRQFFLASNSARSTHAALSPRLPARFPARCWKKWNAPCATRSACSIRPNAMKQAHIGSNFDDFLAQENLLAECEAGALKRVVTWQIAEEMKRRRISLAKLASRMKTSRATLDRLFAGDETPVSLQLLERVALALGRKLKVELA